MPWLRIPERLELEGEVNDNTKPMLEPKDLQKIGEEVGKVIEQNVNPQFDGLRQELDQIRAEMVTKSYLDDKLADLEGSLHGKLRKEDTKVNRLIQILKDKAVLTEEEEKQLAEFQIFPKTS